MVKVQFGPNKIRYVVKCGKAGMSAPHTENTSYSDGTINIEAEIRLWDLEKRNRSKKQRLETLVLSQEIFS